jgi:serine/threonine protein kinase
MDRIIAIDHFSEKDAAAVTADVLNAIHYLHSIGITHRDLKVRTHRRMNCTHAHTCMQSSCVHMHMHACKACVYTCTCMHAKLLCTHALTCMQSFCVCTYLSTQAYTNILKCMHMYTAGEPFVCIE